MRDVLRSASKRSAKVRGLVLLVLMAALVLMGAQMAFGLDMEMVTVGNAGNADDTHVPYPSSTYGTVAPYGAVGYAYKIGKYEVTAGQYLEFLNSAAKGDAASTLSRRLYVTSMSTRSDGCQITRSTVSGVSTYALPVGAESSWASRPANFVFWLSAARFCNWMTSGDSEKGAYDPITGAVDRAAALAAYGRVYVLPTEDEWYKAAYYDPSKTGGAGYWDYPTKSDTAPTSAQTDGANSALFNSTVATYSRANVGTFVSSPGPYGTFDQAGNVREYTQTPDANDTVNTMATRGGSYQEPDSGYLSASNAAMQSQKATMRLDYPGNYATGFRVALIGEPSPAVVIPTGTNVTVSSEGVDVKFSQVTGGGALVVTPHTPDQSAPSGFSLLSDLYYDIHATGSYSFPVTVALHVPASYTGDLTKLKVFHYLSGGGVDTITPTVDVGARTLTFETNSFSDFGVGLADPVVSTPASSPWSLVLGALAALAVLGVGVRFRANGSIA